VSQSPPPSSAAPLAIWTDFGGVLTEPVDVTFTEFSNRHGIPLHALREAMRMVGEAHGTDPMGVLDIPLLDEETWSKEVEAVLAETFGLECDLSNFGDRWFAWRPVNKAWADRLDDFRGRGAFVGLLSNLPPSWERHRSHLAPDSHFDDVVCSHQVATRKPEPEIFALAARRAGVEPGACVLVDDMETNIAGARAAGWKAVLFRDAEQAAREVGALLEEALPPARPH
jgi:putative hydrolase of the HAD superfamily